MIIVKNFVTFNGRCSAMTGEGKGKIVEHGRKYKKVFIYIPKDVASDTSFPFKTSEDVTVKIEGKRLVIEKRDKSYHSEK